MGLCIAFFSGPAAGASYTVYTNSSNNSIYAQNGTEKGASISSQASNGKATIVGYSVFYTPTTGYTGTDKFVYVISTPRLGTSLLNATSYTANITVTLPPPPTAAAVNATVAANSNANAIALGTSGIVTSVAVASPAASGTATASGTAITYTPAAGFSGTDAFTYTASNVGGSSSAATATITVTPPTLGITPASLPAGTQGTAYEQALGASLGTAPYSYAISAGSLPAGLALGSTGNLSGTPTASGDFSFTVQASDAYGATGTQSYVLQIAPMALPVANPASMSVAANSSANPVPLNLAGGAASSVAVAQQAAQGTATASGTAIVYTPAPGFSGTDSFSYTASNAGGTSSPATVTVTVTAAVLDIEPASLPSAMVGAAYAQTLAASLGGAPYSYSILSGSLPDGLSLSSSGSISGTPTASGSFSFTVQARDVYGAAGAQPYALLVAVQMPVAGNVWATVAANSAANAMDLSIAGPVSSVAVASQPAHGTATASGSGISYTPTAGYSGADAFTYTASNASGSSSPATVAVTVSAPVLALAPASLPAGMVGAAYSQSLAASLGTPAYSYVISQGSLASGLVLDASTGQITGTPSGSGSFGFTVQATDRYGATGTQGYALQIAAIPVPVTNASGLTVAANSSPSPVALDISGGAATSVSVVAQAAHGTATVSGVGISYMPAAGFSGSDSFSYAASNAGGTSNISTVTVIVQAPNLVLAASSLPAGVQGTAYSQTLAATQGTAPYAYAISAGSLPAGISLGSDGSLGGTPTASGSFSFTVQVTDSYGATGSQTYVLSITVPVPVANAVSATVAANSAASAIVLNITRATASSVAVVGQAAHGLATASGSSISYTPAAGYSGADSFTYAASNASGSSSPATVTITVTEPLLGIAPASLSPGMAGTPYTQSLVASLGTAPYTYALSAGSLPGGLSLSSAGVLGGTPSAGGSFGFTVQATDSLGATGSQAYTLAIAVPLPVAHAVTASVAANSTGNAIALDMTGTVNSVAVLSQAAHGTATASGSTISYTPMAGYSGSDSFTYGATNASGMSSPAAVALTVTAPTLALSPASLAAGMVGTAYSQTLAASLGTPPYGYAISAGALPPGLTFGAATGQISGAPSGSGMFSFTVQASDSYGATGLQAYQLSVAVPAPVANPVSATVAANSSANPIALNITRAAASSVAVASQAAHGTATASGSSISYTPVAGYSGQDSFAYTASNASGTSAAAVVTVVVTTSTLAIAPASLVPGMVGTAYAQSLTASLGTAPYGYVLDAGSLPAGLVLDAAGGISGTPTASGVFGFSVQASDSYGATGTRSYTLAIAVQLPVATASLDQVDANSTGNPIALSTTGSVTGVAVTSQATHGTATASGSSISYTPAPGYSGQDSFAYSASNASGSSSPATVSVTVKAPALVLAPASLAAATVGLAYSQALTASQGMAPYGYAISAGALPAGLALGTGTGQITGTATASGLFSFTVQVTDSNGATGTQVYTLTVSVPAPVANAVSATVAANSAGNAIALNITRGAASSVAVIEQAAHGTATAVGSGISYTPAPGYSGTDSFTYAASNAGGSSSPATVTITVSEPILSIAPAGLPAGVVGTAYAQSLGASLGTAPYAYALSSGSLPPGLSLGTGGSISGTPAAGGSFSFAVQVSDAHQATGLQSYTLAIAVQPPSAGNAAATVAANSQANGIGLSLGGGAASSVAVSSPPAHGTATASGTAISYTPAAGYSGTDSFGYTATNASGTSAAATVALTVTAPVLLISPATLPQGMAATAYSQGLSASQGTPPYAYAISAGSLPAGLTFNATTAQIMGTPLATGLSSFTVQASDRYGATGSQDYALQVAAIPPPVAGLTILQVAANSADNPVALNVSAGVVSSVALVTQAAHGTVTVSGTSIRYTPLSGYSGQDVFSYTVSNAGGVSAIATVTIQVAASVLGIAPASLAAATVGRAYSQGLVASQGTPPYVYTMGAGSLPPGLSLGSDGSLSGTPTASGSFSFTLQVADSLGAMGSQAYTLSSVLPAPVANDVSATVQANSSANAVALNITRATADSVTLVSQAAHGTATASGAGIRYTPAAGYSGADAFTYAATNAAGTSAAATVTLMVLPPTLSIAPASLPAGDGGAYGQTLSASLGTGPYVYSIISGSLPAGLVLGASGSIGGTPQLSGVFSFTVQALDIYGAVGSRSYALTVEPQLYEQPVVVDAPQAHAVSASVAANSQANLIALKITGGAASSVAVASQAAHGLAVASGTTLTYTPAAGFSGTDTFAYTAANAAGVSAAALVTVSVAAPVLAAVPAAGRLPDAAEGLAYAQTLVVSGGAAPYVFALSSGALPEGLSLSASGRLQGTPQAQSAGSFAFGIAVQDVWGAGLVLNYTLTVTQAAPVAPNFTQALAANGSLELDVTAGATGSPFTGGSVLSVSPADAGEARMQQASPSTGAQPAFLLSFTSGRAFSGTAVIAYTLSNASGTSAPGQVLVQVAPRADPSTDAEVTGLIAAQINSAHRFASTQISIFSQRLESLHADGWGRSNFGLRLNAGSEPGPADRVLGRWPLDGMRETSLRAGTGKGAAGSAQPPRADLPDLPGGEPGAGAARQALAFWVGGAIDYGREAVRGVETQYRFTTSGISAGADWRVNELASLGLGLGLGRDSTLVGVNGSKSTADSVTAMLYASLRPYQRVFVDGVLGYGRLDFDAMRHLSNTADLARGSRQGRLALGAIVAGMEWRQPSWMWSPYLRLEVVRVTLDAYSESAPALQALSYYAQQSSARNGVLGLRGEGAYALAWGRLMPQVRVEYTHAGQRDEQARLAYADLADLGPAYALDSGRVHTGRWTLGLGARLQTRSGVELFLELSFNRAPGSHSRSLSLGLRAPF